MLVVPVAAPSSNVVAAPNALTVAAVAFSKLNVVAVVVISPPLTARSLVITTSFANVAWPLAAIVNRDVADCVTAPEAPVVPVATIKLPLVPFPVARPGVIVKLLALMFVPTAFSPFRIAAIGVPLASLLPKVTVLLRNNSVLILTTVPALATLVAVTLAPVVTLNDAEFSVAPVIGHVPSRLVTPELAMVI